MLMLEKALEKSETDRASLEKELRQLLQGGGGDVGMHEQRDLVKTKQTAIPAPSRGRDAIDVGSLPLFNTRTDDAAATALAALACLVTAGLISYLQGTIGGGVTGGMGGALLVMCGLMGFVLSVVCLFKFFLYLFGANSEHAVNQVRVHDTLLRAVESVS